MKTKKSSFFIVLLSALITLSSCLADGDQSIVLDSGAPQDEIAGIPGDHRAEPSPSVNQNTTVIPNVQYTTEIEGDDVIVRLDMTGVQDPETLEWLRLVGTGGEDGDRQNVWVEVDGKPKGIDVYNTIDDEEDANVATVKNDFVFLVDNSGSMSEEADAIARDIIDWAAELSRNLDVRFGCVGYGLYVGAQYDDLTQNYGIAGALNMTTYEMLDAYLNDRGVSGIYCTSGYAGDDAAVLESYASDAFYNYSGGECGAQALLFADEFFDFRSNANRIYVNFTDDANYPAHSEAISVEQLHPKHWASGKGTVHTVFSGDIDRIESRVEAGIGEYPWLMSEYTSGTFIQVPADFSGVSLNDLPVTMAMQNSYVIRFTNVDEFMDGLPHEVKITIVSSDGHVQAERIFTIVFGE